MKSCNPQLLVSAGTSETEVVDEKITAPQPFACDAVASSLAPSPAAALGWLLAPSRGCEQGQTAQDHDIPEPQSPQGCGGSQESCLELVPMALAPICFCPRSGDAVDLCTVTSVQ